MPDLRKQHQAIQAELQSLEITANDQTSNLQLVETLNRFYTRLRARGNVLNVSERQRVLRLLVKEILVARDKITIRHSIPMPASSPDSNDGVRPAMNRSSPILARVTFCVHTVNTPVTMFPSSGSNDV